MGPVATADLRAGHILRRRRLTRAPVGSVAALSVAVIVAPAVHAALGRPGPADHPPGSRPAAWVLSDGGRITPVGTVRGPLRPVATSSFPQAVTPLAPPRQTPRPTTARPTPPEPPSPPPPAPP